MSRGIVKGDNVMTPHLHYTYEVIAIEGLSAWIRRILPETGQPLDRVVFLEKLSVVTPEFEVGKKYKRQETPYRDRTDLMVTVTAVNSEWAIGWYTDGDPWSRRHRSRENWEEVED